MVEKALETTRLRREVRTLRATQAQPYSFDRIVGDSPPIVQSTSVGHSPMRASRKISYS